uniref:Uncharacterized protein n=1 Tax=Siphoviridae sp. ctfYP22 TaxID=2827584 RepID=A0A8S5LIW9_9CAUD|nr:MAG TPA: hypothetical protein [Siphoviridae sp. ctfYP22]
MRWGIAHPLGYIIPLLFCQGSATSQRRGGHTPPIRGRPSL